MSDYQRELHATAINLARTIKRLEAELESAQLQLENTLSRADCKAPAPYFITLDSWVGKFFMRSGELCVHIDPIAEKL